MEKFKKAKSVRSKLQSGLVFSTNFTLPYLHFAFRKSAFSPLTFTTILLPLSATFKNASSEFRLWQFDSSHFDFRQFVTRYFYSSHFAFSHLSFFHFAFSHFCFFHFATKHFCTRHFGMQYSKYVRHSSPSISFSLCTDCTDCTSMALDEHFWRSLDLLQKEIPSLFRANKVRFRIVIFCTFCVLNPLLRTWRNRWVSRLQNRLPRVHVMTSWRSAMIKYYSIKMNQNLPLTYIFLMTL